MKSIDFLSPASDQDELAVEQLMHNFHVALHKSLLPTAFLQETQ